VTDHHVANQALVGYPRWHDNEASAPVLAQDAPPVWKWDFEQIAATVNRIRAGHDLTPKTWPNGARVAVALSFDMDAETGFLRSGYLTAQPLSRGEYGPRSGLPRILLLLERLLIHMKTRPGVWFATHEQVARAVQPQIRPR